MIYAVDFDNTLAINNTPNLNLFKALINLRAAGHRMILNTCRTGKSLHEAVLFCSRYGLMFDAVNENLPDIIARHGANSRKIFAGFYIDDKAVNPFMGNIIIVPVGVTNGK